MGEERGDEPGHESWALGWLSVSLRHEPAHRVSSHPSPLSPTSFATLSRVSARRVTRDETR